MDPSNDIPPEPPAKRMRSSETTPQTITHFPSTVRPTLTTVTHTPLSDQYVPSTVPHTSTTATEYVISLVLPVQHGHTDHRAGSRTTSTQGGHYEQEICQTSLREEHFPSESPSDCLPVMTDLTRWSSSSTNYCSVLQEAGSLNFHHVRNHGAEHAEESLMRNLPLSIPSANTATIPRSLALSHGGPSDALGVLPRDRDERYKLMLDDVTCNQTTGNNACRDEKNRLRVDVTCNQTVGYNTGRYERNRLMMDVTCNPTADNNTNCSCSYRPLSTYHSQDVINKHACFSRRHHGTMSASTLMEHDGNMDPLCTDQSSDRVSGLQLSADTADEWQIYLQWLMAKYDVSADDDFSDELLAGVPDVSKERSSIPSSKFDTLTNNDHIQQCKNSYNTDSLPAACDQSVMQSKRRTVKHTGQKRYMCETCSKSFTRTSNLKRHERSHIGEKSYLCNDCSAVFVELDKLKIHMRTHTGEKPYECEVCHAKFSQSQHLKSHMRTHTCEKPYECEVCPAKFSHNQTLKTHMRLHTGEKPYECEVCHAKFTHNIVLKSHMTIHTGKKPHGCQECPAKFARRYGLTSHVKIHRNDQPFKCDKCTASFSRLQELTKHGQVHR